MRPSSRRRRQLGQNNFLTFYNRDRFHSAFGGKTPDEVYFAKPERKRPLARVTYFDGALNWYRFG